MQQIQTKGSGSQRVVQNSNKGSAIKDSSVRKMAGTTRSGKPANATTQMQAGANQQQQAFVKLKLADAQSSEL